MPRTEKKSHGTDREYGYQLILSSTVDHIRTLVEKHAPNGTQKNFLLWALNNSTSCQDDYLQVTGIKKISELGMDLLSDVLSNAVIQQLAFYVGALNSYFSFEVVSDNLAIGLTAPKKQDTTANIRRDVLLNFNSIMQQKLTGNTTSTLDLLKPYTSEINAISSYQQSLSTDKLRRIAEKYQQQQANAVDILEHGTMMHLALNIEACLNVTRVMSNHPLAALLTENLNHRYSSVNALLKTGDDVDIAKLIDYSTQAILVVPTLLFMIAALDKAMPNPQLMQIIQNGTLISALKSAACCTRLLNDVGTQLLTSSDKEMKDFQTKLLEANQQQYSFTEFLNHAAQSKPFIVPLTRIYKDLKHGEFNLCLHGLRNITDINLGLKNFFKNLKYCSEIYKKQQQNLTTKLNDISQSLNDKKISQLILRMVTFHEKLYLNEFENNQGEFAV